MKKYILIAIVFVSCAEVYKYDAQVKVKYFNGDIEQVRLIYPVMIHSDGSGDTNPVYLSNGCLRIHNDAVRCGVRSFTIRSETFSRDGKEIKVKK